MSERMQSDLATFFCWETNPDFPDYLVFLAKAGLWRANRLTAV